jgi:hypothetical protein
MRLAQITIRLEPAPPSVGKPEIAIETQTGIGGYGASARKNRRDAGLGYPDTVDAAAQACGAIFKKRDSGC